MSGFLFRVSQRLALNVLRMAPAQTREETAPLERPKSSPLKKRVETRHQADERSCGADHSCHHHNRRHSLVSAPSVRSHNAGGV